MGRSWTHAGVQYRMPRYGDALRLVNLAAAAPRGADLATQAGNAALMAEILRTCWADTPTPPADGDMLDWLMDAGWSLMDIVTSGSACLSQMNDRLFTVSDGAVKNRDFSSTPPTPSTTS